MSQKVYLQPADLAGFLYLILPAVFFFGFYTIPLVAVPAVCFLIYCISRMRITESSNPSSKSLMLLNAIISIAVLLASGAAGPLYVNGDWYKHYAILNELARHSTIAEQGFTVRYYIGAYIVPAFAEKVVGFSHGVIIAAWLSLGLFIFLSQLSAIIQKPVLRYAAPFIFLLFSGADFIGYNITGFERGNINHLEWWAGWVEYSSTITSIFWAPQSTLPAWIALAYLIRRPTIDQKLFVSPLILLSCLLWSPFAALGIAPYLLLTLVHRDFRTADIKIVHLCAVSVLAMLICYYLTFDVEKIPSHWVWNNPCLVKAPGEPCFTFTGYLLFLALEVIPISLLALSSKASRTPITYISVAILAFLPLTQLGLYNDLAMNSSKPALAALIIGMIFSLQGGGKGRLLLSAVILAAGIATPWSEISRSYKLDRTLSEDTDISFFVKTFPDFAQQYITDKKIWFLRSE